MTEPTKRLPPYKIYVWKTFGGIRQEAKMVFAGDGQARSRDPGGRGNKELVCAAAAQMNNKKRRFTKMIDYSEYTSQDRKILTWNKENYDEFIASFTNSELEEMKWYLNNHPFFPIDCDYDEKDRTGCIVCDYVRHWLYEQIESGITCGTRELFEAVMALT